MNIVAPKISIIVPVYNAEKYIDRCLQSIIHQSFTDWELIIVNDGSTDKSSEICEYFAKQDKRIRVFHKKNEGVALARQLGIEKAKGEYSIHVDSDDWIEENMLEEMFKSISENEADILISDFYVDQNGKTFYREQRTTKILPTDILREIFNRHLFGSLWHKLIRHSLYRKYNIHFIPEINYCEDVLVLAQLLQLDIKVAFLHKAFYHYNQECPNSITKNYTKAIFSIRKNYVNHLINILPESFNDIKSLAAYQVKQEGFILGFFNKKEFYQYMPDSFSLHNIITERNSRKIKICMLFAYFKLYNFAKFLYKHFLK